jgi:hypothetical protein
LELPPVPELSLKNMGLPPKTLFLLQNELSQGNK